MHQEAAPTDVGVDVERVVHRASQPREDEGALAVGVDADPVTTEVIRHALNSAAGQMKWVVTRAAFSPVIYEVFDFAVALYDRQIRLLAQAPSLPIFMGTMSFCIEHAVDGVGGEENLEPGDIILYNWPYGVGSHANDAALVMPIFASDEEFVGYSVIKEHWVDIGAKEVYCTDTTDVFQEGTFFPGVKLFRRGERDSDLYRTLLCNSRMPKLLAGDIGAQVTGLRAGYAALARLVERYGLPLFRAATEQMFDHGEAIARQCFENVPDGRYAAHGQLDNNGVDDELIPFEIAVEIEGSTVRVDYSNAPEAQRGPTNSPLPCTVSVTRLAMSLFAGGGSAPHEGMYRPVEIVTRPGSLFHPLPPSPCFLFAWPASQAVDVIYRALAQAVPDRVPASSGGDVHGLQWWGSHPDTGEAWFEAAPHPCGQGAHAHGDGASALQHYALGIARRCTAEVYETKTQLVIAQEELAPDSCGPGKHRGGLGIDNVFESRDDGTYGTPVVERTRSSAWGLAGGGEGRPNSAALHLPDGTVIPAAKATAINLPTGSRYVLETGGGGGFGPPSERDPKAVLDDLRDGYITEAHARKYYAHAFADAAGASEEDKGVSETPE